jgi:hypothetical protein
LSARPPGSSNPGRPQNTTQLAAKSRSTLRETRAKPSRITSRLAAFAGIVLYTGTATLPFGDRLRAMPVSALWEVGPGR